MLESGRGLTALQGGTDHASEGKAAMAAAVLSAAEKLQMGEDVLALLKTDEAPAGRLAAMAAALAAFTTEA